MSTLAFLSPPLSQRLVGALVVARWATKEERNMVSREQTQPKAVLRAHFCHIAKARVVAFAMQGDLFVPATTDIVGDFVF